ncbi:MAG: hypothetical protein ACHQPI_13810 [Thermoanaerobaculia bacterium]
MQRVSVNKGLLIGVVAIAVMSLLALAFLLGRASESGSPTGPPKGRELPVGAVASPVSGLRAPDQPLSPPSPAAPSIAEPAVTRPASGPAPSAPEQRASPQALSLSAPAPAEGERDSAGTASARAAVAAYFDAVDHIQAGKVGEAEGVANEMAAALAKGDTSGLDRMIRETEEARGSLGALAPPASCAAHYRESLGSLDDALEILRSLKTAMESPEPAAQLTGITTRATALRSRAEALQKEEAALRQRYGLTR